ncbi:MAG: DMT family transporter [Deltaproteobacteria bacterium]|nr:DMT family transporter [Deltaproteobacteria bacterium]
MTNLYPVFIMMCAGAAVALQPSINARLAEKTGLLESACISFAVGTVALLLVVLGSGRWTVKGLAETAWWEWTGGLLGAFFVTATILIVPRIGTTATMAASIAAQLITALILDHFGLFGFGGAQIDLKRSTGAFLLIVGAWLIIRR